MTEYSKLYMYGVEDEANEPDEFEPDEGALLRYELVQILTPFFGGDDAEGLIKYASRLEDYIKLG